MNSKTKSSNINKSQPKQLGRNVRIPYTKPKLREFGDVRDLTLGSSPGTTDSGMMGKDGGM